MSDLVEIEGTVVASLPNTLFWVELPNGHRVLAHVAPKLKGTVTGLAAGDKVTMKMTPFDFSKGCIVKQ